MTVGSQKVIVYIQNVLVNNQQEMVSSQQMTVNSLKVRQISQNQGNSLKTKKKS